MIDFYLMTEKGFLSLKATIEKGFRDLIKNVIIGRDNNLTDDFSAQIKSLCEEFEIDYCYKDGKLNQCSDYSIAISWRWIINDVRNLIVIHDSILPKYRGFAPLVNSLTNGEKEIGATALFASEKYDRGDIICQHKISVTYPIKISNAIKAVSGCYIKNLEFIFESLKNGRNLPRLIQNEADASYSLWLDEDNYKINWSKSSSEIRRFIDATGEPYACAYSLIDNIKLSIISAEEIEDVIIVNREFGKVIFIENGFPVVVCGTGLLKLTNIINRDSKKCFLPLKKFRIRFK